MENGLERHLLRRQYKHAMNKLSWATVAGALLIGAWQLRAEDPKTNATYTVASDPASIPSSTLKPAPELDVLHARVVWLEQKLAATEAKMTALMQFYGAQDQLTNLAKQEPKLADKEKK